MRFLPVLLSVAILSTSAVAVESDRLRVAITTTTENSGLMARLHPLFETRRGVTLDVVVTGSTQALRLGANGDVDVVLVHAPAAEQQFIAAGHGLERIPIMHNQFALLGPADDPHAIRATHSITEALALIAHHDAPFVSRGDESGTHLKERQLWELAGIDTHGDHYLVSGRGMGASLLLADEQRAYILSDMGTFLSMRDRLDLSIIYTDETLQNPYHAIAVNPGKYPHVNHALARQYIEFLAGAEAQRLIGAYQSNQERLFHPRYGAPGGSATHTETTAHHGFFVNAAREAFHLITHFDAALFLVVRTSLGVSFVAVVIASLIAVPLGVLVALTRFPGRKFLLGMLNTLMALPTVIVGLLLYGLLNRQGLLGGFGLLYTPVAMIIGQALLITPIVWNLSIAAAVGADPRLRITCLSLGANLYQQGIVYISEVRFALMAAVVVGFGRAIGEVGIAMMLGGNIEGFTRTMTTAIALETSKGEFEFALALGVILLIVALLVNGVLQQFQESKHG